MKTNEMNKQMDLIKEHVAAQCAELRDPILAEVQVCQTSTKSRVMQLQQQDQESFSLPLARMTQSYNTHLSPVSKANLHTPGAGISNPEPNTSNQITGGGWIPFLPEDQSTLTVRNFQIHPC